MDGYIYPHYSLVICCPLIRPHRAHPQARASAEADLEKFKRREQQIEEAFVQIESRLMESEIRATAAEVAIYELVP